MIALEINQNRIVGQAYRVSAFFAPPVIGEAIDATNFRTLEGPALPALLDDLLQGRRGEGLVIGLSGTTFGRIARDITPGMTNDDLRKADRLWAQSLGFTTDDDLRATRVTLLNGKDQQLTYVVSAAILGTIRAAAKAHDLTIERIGDIIYGWAQALPQDAHLVVDTSEADNEIVTIMRFTPPIAIANVARIDADLRNDIEQSILSAQRLGSGTGLIQQIYKVGQGIFPYESVMNFPVLTLPTELPAELQRHIGLLGLAGYAA